ncbi:hypothetical protein KIN20_032067, partial [Parelaphostrongylus tenuis]
MSDNQLIVEKFLKKPLHFNVNVKGTWRDVIAVNYIPEWVQSYTLTRVYQTGEREVLRTGSYTSQWKTK